MQRHQIPTARYGVFSSSQLDEARRYLDSQPVPVVLKADGLAAGKGVLVCLSRAEAGKALEELFRDFGAAGRKIVVEEFLEGEEASIFVITDGQDFAVLAPAQDHKRAFDGDTGKNTGGMGAYAPAPVVTPTILGEVLDRIVVPTLEGMAAEGRTYTGCLYVGLMITPGGTKVVEYNSRFGDPETQVVLPLCTDNLLDVLMAASTGRMAQYAHQPLTREGSAVCVVLASGGYPGHYETGKTISGLAITDDRIAVFHAGTRLEGGTIVTAGGRVLGVTAIGEPLAATISRAYEAVARITFEGMFYRRDIGRKALKRT
jgi:phosphoribosylamine--glycine ligase